MMILRLCLMATVAFSGALYAQISPNECRRFPAVDGKIIVVNGRLNDVTHITFPDELLVTPIIGSTLWEVQGLRLSKHVFIKPITALENGQQTTMTVLTADNRAYNFRLNRTDGPGDLCVIIENTDGPFIKDTRPMVSAGSTTRLKQMDSELASLKSSLSRKEQETEQAVVNAIKLYQGQIYSNYKPVVFGSNKLVKSLVASVHDDGRFTYVRLYDDRFGIPAVSGVRGGEEVLIDPPYDDSTRTFKIAGLYPELSLRYGDSGVRIIRADYK